jgi:hypothetical protein
VSKLSVFMRASEANLLIGTDDSVCTGILVWTHRHDPPTMPLIPLLPKHYRAIVLEVLADFPGATVWIGKQRCDDLSETGPLNQRGMARMRDFEIRTGAGTPILGFHDHPREMWMGAEFRQLAQRLSDLGHLKIQERGERTRSPSELTQPIAGAVVFTGRFSGWGIAGLVLLLVGFGFSLYRDNYAYSMAPSTWSVINALSAVVGFAAVVCGSIAMHRQSALWLLIVLPATFLALAGYLGDF